MRWLLLLGLLGSPAYAENLTYYSQAIAFTSGIVAHFVPLTGGPSTPVVVAALATGQYTLPRAVLLWRMDCCAGTAASSAQTRTFTIATGGTPTDSAMTCTTATNGTCCSVSIAAGVAVAAGTAVVLESLGTATAAATNASCETLYTYQ